jgi:hypothetical protein
MDMLLGVVEVQHLTNSGSAAERGSRISSFATCPRMAESPEFFSRPLEIETTQGPGKFVRERAGFGGSGVDRH